MECNHWIPKLNVTLGTYNMTDSFYVVNVADTNVVLGVQWLYSIGKYNTDYRAMEMEFQGYDGKRVVLRGMETYPPKPVSSQRMEAVLRQGDIEWSAECFVTFRKPPDNNTQHLADIQALLQKHEKVFRDLPTSQQPMYRRLTEVPSLVQSARNLFNFVVVVIDWKPFLLSLLE